MNSVQFSAARSADPRADMAVRLPAFVQPLLTWITAMPAPGRPYRTVATWRPVAGAFARIAVGLGLSAAGVEAADIAWGLALYVVGAVLTVSGLGFLQVALFHYCAHNNVFRSPAANVACGRALSILCLFKYFDDYRREHIQHHRSQKLITEEDEFATFVVDVCRMRPGMSRAALWRRLSLNLVSPAFHAKFLYLRLRGNLGCGRPAHVWRFIAAWAATFAAVTALGCWPAFAAAWLLPLVVFLQIATVFRILCEHRIPAPELLADRGKALIADATTGVFSGRPLPAAGPDSLSGLAQWAFWWADLLSFKTLARLLVLVADASCHDYHHRRSGRSHWPDAIHERAADKASGCPGYPQNYVDVWGLMNAVDQNIRSLAAAAPDLLGRAERPAMDAGLPAPGLGFATAAK